MFFLRDLDMVHELELLIKSDMFKKLFPDYDETKRIREEEIPDYDNLQNLFLFQYVDEDYVKKEKIKPDFWIRWKLLDFQDSHLVRISHDICKRKNEELYPFYANYDFIDLDHCEMMEYYHSEMNLDCLVEFRIIPSFIRKLSQKEYALESMKSYVNDMIGYKDWERDEWSIFYNIETYDEEFQNILKHNSKDGKPLPWPLFNTAEGQQYIAKKMKEFRIPKIISKARELYDKSDVELEPMKYQLHYLKEEPLFKELSEDKNEVPNYVKLLSERIAKFESEHQDVNYEIDYIRFNVIQEYEEKRSEEIQKKWSLYQKKMLESTNVEIE